MQSTSGSAVFAKVDMCHAYWQLPLHAYSQECMSIQTPLGVFTPTRALQGSTDAGNHFQSCLSQVFSELHEHLLHWQDDGLAHANDEEQHIKLLRRIFALCEQYGLKLHAKKCELFLREAKFCGRLIDSDGVRHYPRAFETLANM